MVKQIFLIHFKCFPIKFRKFPIFETHFRFSNLKKEYLGKSPHEKWFFVRKINSLMLIVFGCEFMEANYKPSIRSLTPVYLIANYFGLLVYTLYYYRNDPFRALEPTPAAGLYLPVCLANNLSLRIYIKLIIFFFNLIGLSIVHYYNDSINMQTISIYV